MRRWQVALVALVAFALGLPFAAFGADTTIQIIPTSQTPVPQLQKDLGSGVYAPAVVPVNASGTPVSSTTQNTNVAQVGGSTAAVGAAGQLQTALYAQSSTPGDTALLTGDTNNATSAVGSLKSAFIGRYNATLPALTDTRYSMLQLGPHGALQVTLTGPGVADSAVGADVYNGMGDAAGSPLALKVGAHLDGFNGATWDRLRAGTFTASTTPTGLLNALPVGRFNTTGPTALTNGQFGHIQLTSLGSTIVGMYTVGDNSGTISGTSELVGSPLQNDNINGNNIVPYNVSIQAAWNGSNLAHRISTAANTGDASGTNASSTGILGYNGTNWDRLRFSSIGTGILVAAPPDYSYSHIAAGTATTTVKSGAGFLHNVCFNNAATATNTTTIYDNTAASGTVIAIPAATTATVTNCMTYDVKFATGLTIITATANGSDMTISYR